MVWVMLVWHKNYCHVFNYLAIFHGVFCLLMNFTKKSMWVPHLNFHLFIFLRDKYTMIKIVFLLQFLFNFFYFPLNWIFKIDRTNCAGILSKFLIIIIIFLYLILYFTCPYQYLTEFVFPASVFSHNKKYPVLGKINIMVIHQNMIVFAYYVHMDRGKRSGGWNSLFQLYFSLFYYNFVKPTFCQNFRISIKVYFQQTTFRNCKKKK